MERLGKIVAENVGVRCSGRSYHKNEKTVTLGFEGRDQLIRLYDWFYHDGGSCLKRKHEVFRQGLCAGEIAERMQK